MIQRKLHKESLTHATKIRLREPREIDWSSRRRRQRPNQVPMAIKMRLHTLLLMNGPLLIPTMMLGKLLKSTSVKDRLSWLWADRVGTLEVSAATSSQPKALSKRKWAQWTGSRSRSLLRGSLHMQQLNTEQSLGKRAGQASLVGPHMVEYRNSHRSISEEIDISKEILSKLTTSMLGI